MASKKTQAQGLLVKNEWLKNDLHLIAVVVNARVAKRTCQFVTHAATQPLLNKCLSVRPCVRVVAVININMMMNVGVGVASRHHRMSYSISLLPLSLLLKGKRRKNRREKGDRNDFFTTEQKQQQQ